MQKRHFPEDLERMSTASLEKLLLWDFQSQEPGESNMSGLFRAAEILAEREDSGANPDRAWELFVEKYLPFTGAGSSLYVPDETRSVSSPAVQSALPFRRKRPPPARAAVRRTARTAVCLPEDDREPRKSGASFFLEDGEGSPLLYTHASPRSKQREIERHRAAVEGLAAQDVLVNGSPASYYRSPDGTSHLAWTDSSGGFHWICGPLPLEGLLRMAEREAPGS